MKRVLIINPNTNSDMTELILNAAKEFDTELFKIEARNAAHGPLTIENNFERILASNGFIREIRKGVARAYDGFIEGAICDPGLFGAKEISSVPVVGLGEASMLLSLPLGYKFSILAANNRFKPIMLDLVKSYGLLDRCASVRVTGLTILQTANDRDLTTNTMIKEGRRAIEEDSAEILILGSAAMGGLARPIQEELSVPVIDPVIAGMSVMDMLLRSKQNTSKINLFKTPETKEIR